MKNRKKAQRRLQYIQSNLFDDLDEWTANKAIRRYESRA